MAKTITFDLSVSSIENAIKEVREIQDWIARKKIELMRRLAEHGVAVAKLHFTNASYAGRNDVSVTMQWDANSATVIASGEAVAFIEFGTGITYAQFYPGEVPDGVSPIGTYGKGQGANPDGWVYKGEKGTTGVEVSNRKGETREGVYFTRGNPPAMAMYHTARDIERNFTNIVREVFGS